MNQIHLEPYDFDLSDIDPVELPEETTEEWREWALIHMNNEATGDYLGTWLDDWFGQQC